MIFSAFAIPWTQFSSPIYQGFVVSEDFLVQTIQSGPNLENVKLDLGLNRTDLPWQQRASATYDTWTLIYEGLLDQAQTMHLFDQRPAEDSPIVIDPVLGLPINRYVGPTRYRSELPNVVWLFNPWTGKHRSAADIENDPQGLLI